MLAREVGLKLRVVESLQLRFPATLHDEVRRLERIYVAEALRATRGNQTRAAVILGVTFRSLRHLVQSRFSRDERDLLLRVGREAG